MKLLRALPILLLSALSAISQQLVNFTASTGDIALVAAGTTATIQAATIAAQGEQIALQNALVSCTVACTITQSQNGTAASATAGTIVSLIPAPGRGFTTTFWTASNVGAGTAVGGAIKLTAAGSVVIDLSKIQLGTQGSTTNYSITISSITGTANITFFGSKAI